MMFRKASDPARRPYRRQPRQLTFEHLERRWTPSVDVLTYHYDNARDGQDTAETSLTPSNVDSTNFGKKFTLPTDGYVYAQPLLKTGVSVPSQGTHDILLVATEHDSVYAFDAQGNNPSQGYLWKDSFINPAQGVTTVPNGDVGTNDIAPEIGITGTPVIDPSTNTLYVVAKTKEVSGSTTAYVQRLHALDLATGAEKFNGPEIISASTPGTGDGGTSDTFDAKIENQRASLALVNGVVYVAFASHGDNGAYHGWVLGYKASDVTKQVSVYNTTPNGQAGGVWMSGGGISADPNGNLFLGVGNGTFDANTNGGRDYGDSAVKLATGSGLSVNDFFTPSNQATLSATDTDFGVSDVLLLPDQSGSHPHEAITADKGGTLYLLDRDSMGGYQGNNNDVGETSIGKSLHNNLAYFNGSVYVAGDGNPLQAYPLSNGTLGAVATSASGTTFGTNGEDGSGVNPVISANGTSNGIVWALDNSGYSSNSPAVLHAYLASDLSKELYNSTQAANLRDQAGAAVKFSAPVVANGLVYVPGESSVTVYGLLPPPTTAASTPVNLSPSFNRTGIVNDGATFPAAGGLDGDGYALSSNLLGSGLTWASTPFALGPVGAGDVVSAAGQTVALPAGSYSSVRLLAAAVNGNRPGQVFTVRYTDGTAATFTQSISDWYTPQGYPGESAAVTMGYRDGSDGARDGRTFYLYGYSFPLDPTKTVSSITLPNDPNVEVLGIAMVLWPVPEVSAR